MGKSKELVVLILGVSLIGIGVVNGLVMLIM